MGTQTFRVAVSLCRNAAKPALIRIEQMVAVFAGQFGLMHSLVGLPQQLTLVPTRRVETQTFRAAVKLCRSAAKSGIPTQRVKTRHPRCNSIVNPFPQIHATASPCSSHHSWARRFNRVSSKANQLSRNSG